MRGLRLFDQPVLGGTGFSPSELADIYYGLISDENAGLMFESESLDVMDAAYNPGEPVTESMVLDAVTAKYNRFPKTMAALQRVFNRQLPDAIKAEEPAIGTPKVSAGFATVTVQFPFSDGQTVSIIFHAPDNDPKKINGADEVIAFRWLLNQRDITHIVAPEMTQGIMRDIPLQTVGKRITQLVEKNSARFTKKQGEVTQQREDLARNEELVKTLSDQTVVLADEVGRAESSTVSNVSTIEQLQATLADLRAENERLQARIDELKAKKNDVDPMTLLDAKGQAVLKELLALGGNAESERFNDRWMINYEAPGIFASVNDGEPATSAELARMFAEEVRELIITEGAKLEETAQHNALVEFLKGSRLPEGWERNFDANDPSDTWVGITTNIIPADPEDAGENGEFYGYGIFTDFENGEVKFILNTDGGESLNGSGNTYLTSWREAINLMKADANLKGVGQPKEPELDDLHWYGLQARPAGFGGTPKEFAKVIDKAELEHNLSGQKIIEGFPAHAYRHGIIGYARELTPEEISNFELFDFSRGNGANLWTENDLAEKLYELGQMAESFSGEFAQFFTDVVKSNQSPFWDTQNNKFAAVQLQTALQELYGERAGGQKLLKRFWQEQTGKDPEADKVHTDRIAEALVFLLRNAGFDADSTEIAFKTFAVGFEKGDADGTAYVYKDGSLKVDEYHNGERYIDNSLFKTAEEAAEYIISQQVTTGDTGSKTPEVELTINTPLVVNGKSFKISEVSHDEGQLTFNDPDGQGGLYMGMGRIMSFDNFEKEYGVKVKRRPVLVDDGTAEYYEARIEQLRWDIENTNNGHAKNNKATRIRELEDKLAKAQGVDNIAITDEMVENYRNAGAYSDTLQWLREKFGYSYPMANALMDRIEEESNNRHSREYTARPEVRLAQRIFNHLEKDYPSSKRSDGVRPGLTIPIGAGRVGMGDDIKIEGEMFTLEAGYWPRDSSNNTFSYEQSRFKKKYQLVEGLILDSASKAAAVLEEIRGDIAVFVRTFETRVDNSNLPAYGSKLEETDGLHAKELAALIRGEIKDKMKSGVLPKGKYSVRKESAGSIYITVQELPQDFPLFNPEFLKAREDNERWHGGRITRYHNETSALLTHLEAIGEQYNYNRSDSMTDYFDYRFSLSVNIDYKLESEREESEKAKPEAEPEVIDVEKLKEQLRMLEDMIETEKSGWGSGRSTEELEKRAEEIRALLSGAGVDTKPEDKRKEVDEFSHSDPLVMEVYNLEKEWKGLFNRSAKVDGVYKRRLRALAKKIPSDNNTAVLIAERFSNSLMTHDWDNVLKSEKNLEFAPPGKKDGETDSAITEAVETLKKAAAGEFQTFAATMDAAEQAINTLDAAGVADDYDDLIGQATDKAFEMDTAENGA